MPNGFVFAASMTSHTLIAKWSQSMASSFTKAMLTARKVFSKTLDSSATRGSAITMTEVEKSS